MNVDGNKFILGDIIASLIGLLPWLRGTKAPGITDGDGLQKIISTFHAFISKVDEGIWTTLLSKLSETQKQAITLLLEHLKGFHEVESFRYTLVNAPAATTSTIIDEDVPDPADKTKTKKIKRVVKVGEYSDQDARVVFLRQIADLVDKWGPKEVCNMLRTHQLVTENKVARQALAFWNKSLVWAEKEVCEFFGVKKLKDITFDHFTDQVNKAAEKVEKRKVHPGSWKQFVFWKSVLLGGRGNRNLFVATVLFTLFVAWKYSSMF